MSLMDPLRRKTEELRLAGMEARAEVLAKEDWRHLWAVGKHALNLCKCSAMVKKAQVFMRLPIQGLVADLGSGVGTLTAILARLDGVEEVWAVEHSVGHVEYVMPVALEALGVRNGRVRGVCASFNRVPARTNSFDFVAEFSAFHHSENLQETVNEATRILKPGGWLIALETPKSVLPDNCSDRDVQQILDKPWGNRECYGDVVDVLHTRRDWGEHAYRRSEWLETFVRAGLKPYCIRFKAYSRRSPRGLFREVLFRLAGDCLLAKRVTEVTYPSWFGRGISCVLFLCEKPA